MSEIDNSGPDEELTDEARLLHAQPEEAAAAALTDGQIGQLRSYGEVSEMTAGEVLFAEGTIDFDLLVVLKGSVEVIRSDETTGEELVIGIGGVGNVVGELGVLTGEAALARVRAATDGSVLRIGKRGLQELIGSGTEVGDLVFANLVALRNMLLDSEVTAAIRIIGSRYSSTALDLVSFARRMRVVHQWIDVDTNGDIDRVLRSAEVSRGDMPVVVTDSGVLRSPSVAEFAAHIGLLYRPTSLEVHDVVVVGAGPAGLAAAVYGASEGLDTLVLDGASIGGQAGTSSRIENLFGFPSGISGSELAERAALQARRLGAQISVPAVTRSIEAGGDGYRLVLEDGTAIVARSVILALGVQYRKLPLDRLEEFEGAGVYYSATELEARVVGASPVTVVGGGNSAGQAAIFLAGRGATVSIAIRGESLAATMSEYLLERIEASPVIQVETQSEVSELGGDDHLSQVTVTNRQTGSSATRECLGLFLFIGAVPSTEWLDGFIELDDKGFVVTDSMVASAEGFDPLPFETSRPGVFAAGDVRLGSMKRVAAAVGEGSSAIRSVHRRLSGD